MKLVLWCAAFFIAVAITTVVSATSIAERDPKQFQCVLCEAFVRDVFLPPTGSKGQPPHVACRKTLDGCSFLLPHLSTLQTEVSKQNSDEGTSSSAAQLAHRACQNVELCIPDEAPLKRYTPRRTASPHVLSTSVLPDVKIAPGYGSRPYGSIRLTVIDMESNPQSPTFVEYFNYSAQFLWRWTDRHLYTTVVNVVPGVPTTLDVGGRFNMTVQIPKLTDTVRGVLVADPCYSSRYMICIFGSLLKIDQRLSELLSVLGDTNAVDFYGVLGDNFYDRDGTLAPPFFESLSDGIKSKLLVTVPGNHDFWMMGDPWLAQPTTDSDGNGFMQYYGQDVAASLNQFPYNLTIDPDKENVFDHYDRLPNFENYFFYNRVGPVGFIGFSGAHFLSDLTPKLMEACSFFSQNEVQWILLVGHWNTAGSGAFLNMSTNNLYHATLMQLPGCKEIGTERIKYLLGHTHCNVVDDINRGFMIGGFGMGGGWQDCGDFGIPYIEASPSNLLISYYPIAHRFDWLEDGYNALLSCIETVGLSNCRELGRVWLNVTA